jgi:hypothetical protein
MPHIGFDTEHVAGAYEGELNSYHPELKIPEGF